MARAAETGIGFTGDNGGVWDDGNAGAVEESAVSLGVHPQAQENFQREGVSPREGKREGRKEVGREREGGREGNRGGGRERRGRREGED